MYQYRNETPDWALRERNRLAQLTNETHLAPDSGPTALQVVANSGEADTTNTFSVEPGTAFVGGARVTLDSSIAVGIDSGAEDRRDVIYCDETGTIRVAKGDPAPFSWDDDLALARRTVLNAERPAPRTLSNTDGLVLAVVSVPANAGYVTIDGNVTDERLPAPSVTASDGYDLTDDMDETEVRETVNTAAEDAFFTLEPGATWELSGPLQPPYGGTILARGNLNSPPHFTKGFNGPLVEMNHYVSLCNLALDGNRGAGWSGPVIDVGAGGAQWRLLGVDASNAAGDGVTANCYLSRIRNCRMRGNGGYGIRFPDLSDGEQPHNEISGPTSISDNGAGGIYIGDTSVGGKNIAIHAWIGHNGGPGIHATGELDTLDVMAHITSNDGPAWLQDGGEMRATLRSCLFNHNCENPTGLTSPVGEIHIESGSLHTTIVQPWVKSVNTTTFISAPSVTESTVELAVSGGTPVEGDIDGNLRLTASDIAALSGSVNVNGAVALDSAQETVRVGPTLGETVGETTLGTLANETANRTSGTWYQNTTGGPLQVTVWSQDSAGGSVKVSMHVNNDQNNRLVVADSNPGDGTATTHVTTNVLVPDGRFYKVDTAHLHKWSEAPLS